MWIKNRFLIVLVSLLAAGAVEARQAAPATPTPLNVTGRWIGTLKPTGDGEGKPTEHPLVILKQDRDVVTGTIGPDDNQRLTIAKGKLTTTKDGTTFTFELSNNQGMLMQFDLKYVEGRFKGAATAERDGQKRTATFELEREK